MSHDEYKFPPVPGTSPITATAHNEQLVRSLERLVEVYSVATVLEQLAVVCEIKAAHEQATEQRVPARKLQEIGLDLMTLSERAYAL